MCNLDNCLLSKVNDLSYLGVHSYPINILESFQYKQWYTGEFNNQLSRGGRRGILVFSICQFLWSENFYSGWLQVTNRTSLNKMLGQDVHSWFSQADASQLQHTAKKETQTHLLLGAVSNNLQSFCFGSHILLSGHKLFTLLQHTRANLIPLQY